MEIHINVLFLLCTAGAVAVLLLLAYALYLALYRRHINAVLQSGRPGRKWPSPHTLAVWFPVLLGVGVLSFWAVDSAWDLTNSRIQNEQELRAAFAAGESADWEMDVSMTDNLAAALAWNPDRSDCKFAFYRNDSALKDYVFRRGGSLSSIEEGILMMEQEGSLVIYTLNKPGIARILCDNGGEYVLDPDRPFALVIPNGGDILVENIGNNIWKCTGYTGIRVFDRNGVEMDLMELEYVELRPQI